MKVAGCGLRFYITSSLNCSPIMKASQLASNALRSSVPKVPKSSVIKSSIEVHPIAFNSSLFILIFNESCELRVAFSLCKKHDDYLEEMAIHFIFRQISHLAQCYYGTAYAYSRVMLINLLSYGTDVPVHREGPANRRGR